MYETSDFESLFSMICNNDYVNDLITLEQCASMVSQQYKRERRYFNKTE